MKILVLLPLLALAACGHGDDGVVARQDDSAERFYSGCARPGEFLRPTDLPAIPPSFDEDVR
ncbi:hypothetical protein N5E30_20305 [Pseudomonas chengduensis]|jgi:hypothetical protein|uniref:Uncharacterized protein n=2 Tax=Ectopseudomonas TaxID=3236654 RepID=A0A1G6WN83_9GAMM|nr:MULTISPECIES: hypothetical protein [Pseudomonas]PKM13294.1 MAG: hypothetical protein CVV15_02480 [Gammaproteobacteria bacterium HGW-Gammaproteobacteria-5]MBP3064355.1 hypothetical protein [Pseudomonas chengduensis]MDH1683897.1 hypothetical protein [Pseudomonas chengduensis]MDI5993605.1 hypothetical protein [Pseudomonas sp. MDMC216]MDI6006595.1 hypothetical protein [Pseudomonas sp. MDMC17]